jgi:hypothetical protein
MVYVAWLSGSVPELNVAVGAERNLSVIVAFLGLVAYGVIVASVVRGWLVKPDRFLFH